MTPPPNPTPSPDELADALAGLNHTGAVPDDVRRVVVGFISAHFAWEVSANANCQDDDDSAAWDKAAADYAELIREWCCNEVEAQGISFGSDPNHNPASERVVGGAGTDERFAVRTAAPDPKFGFETDYEYHLRRDGKRWLIEHLYFVDDDGKRHECL